MGRGRIVLCNFHRHSLIQQKLAAAVEEPCQFFRPQLFDFIDAHSGVHGINGLLTAQKPIQLPGVPLVAAGGLQTEHELNAQRQWSKLSAVGDDDILVDEYQIIGDINRTYTVATNSFMSSGGDRYYSFGVGKMLLDESNTIGEQEVLETYIREELKGVVDMKPLTRATSRFVSVE